MILISTVMIFIFYKIYIFYTEKYKHQLPVEINLYMKLLDIKDKKYLNIIIVMIAFSFALILEVVRRINKNIIINIVIAFLLLMAIHLLTILLIKIIRRRK